MDLAVEKTQHKYGKKASHIHFAVLKENGRLVSLSEASEHYPSGCVCLACGNGLDIIKDDAKKLSFSHKGNIVCLDGLELSIYKTMLAVLLKSLQILLPQPASSSAKLQKLTSAELLSGSAEQPTLIACYAGQAFFRIALNIDGHLSAFDCARLAKQARSAKASLLLINIESNKMGSFSAFEEVLYGNASAKKWLYNKQAEILAEKSRQSSAITSLARGTDGFETAVYRAAHALLAEKLMIMLPQTSIQLPAQQKAEIISKAGIVKLTGSEYTPGGKLPCLACSSGKNAMHIIINFENRLSGIELSKLRNQARQKETSLLLISVPDSNKINNKEALSELLFVDTRSKKWLYNNRIDKLQTKGRNSAALSEPQNTSGIANKKTAALNS
jgi:hypothetical protein